MVDLTPKQAAFAKNLFIGMNQSEAYRKAGYAVAKQTHATLRANASRLANNVNVLHRIDELQQRAIDNSVATVLERKQVLTEITRGRFVDFMTNLTADKLKSAALQEIRVNEGKDGKTTTIKLHSPITAIAELNKMEGIYTDGPTVNIDNRKQELIVSTEKAKAQLLEIAEGIPPHTDENH